MSERRAYEMRVLQGEELKTLDQWLQKVRRVNSEPEVYRKDFPFESAEARAERFAEAARRAAAS